MTVTSDYEEKLRKANERAEKTYQFSEDADPSRVHEWFFQESNEGTILFVIYYTLACRWNLCTGCNLPSVSSAKHIDFKALMRQTDYLFSHRDIVERKGEIQKCIFSNNGSMLDEETFSSTALMYLLAKCNMEFPELRCISLETRVEYVDLEELEFLARALREGPQHPELELAIGFEAFDDEIRNRHFLKGLTLNNFEELVSSIAPYGYHLKTYFMQKPVPEFDDEGAVADVRHAIDYLTEMSEKYKVSINMHLNPTYAAKGTKLARQFEAGLYTPPKLRDVARAALHSKGKPISVFIGLSDEGLAVPGGSFLDYEEGLSEPLQQFNRSQDHSILEGILED